MILVTLFIFIFASNDATKVLYHGVICKNPISHTSIVNDYQEVPIVILHGLLGNARNFQSWAKLLHQQLEGKRDIVCMDLRNHGSTGSAYGGLPMNYDLMANDVLHTIKWLGFDQVHIIGHSMG